MGFEFNPEIWFICRFCRREFQDMDMLKKHKIENHLGECLTIKCILFEEKCLDFEWTPSSSSLTDATYSSPFKITNIQNTESSLRSKANISTGNDARKNYHNPFVALQRLTPEEIESASKSDPSQFKRSAMNNQGCRGKKRTIDWSASASISKFAGTLSKQRRTFSAIFNVNSNELPLSSADEDCNVDINILSVPEIEEEINSDVIHVKSEIVDDPFFSDDLPIYSPLPTDEDLEDPSHDVSTTDDQYLLDLPSPVPVAAAPMEPRLSYSNSTRRNVSKVNYSEVQACRGCAKDFYTVEDVEEHEKGCILVRKKIDKPRSSSSSQSQLVLLDNEIQIVGSSTQSSSEEIVCDVYNDNYEPLDNSGSETGSDIEGDPIDPEPHSSNCSKIAQNLPTATLTLTKENSLPLKEWLLLQWEKPAHSDGYKNVVRIDPDPSLGGLDPDPSNVVIDKDHPVTCLLCSLLLFSEVHLKNHVENCWFHNKDKHRYCVLCEFRFQSPSLLKIHQQFDHFNYDVEARSYTSAGTVEGVTAQSTSKMLQEPIQPVLEDESDAEVINVTDKISLVDWLNERKGRASKNIILLDPDPTEAKTPIKVSKSSPIRCKLCHRLQFSEYRLKLHVKKCWRYNKKAHRFCIPCNKRVGNPTLLSSHNREHHALDEGPKFSFYCKQCHTGFANHRDLRIHKMSHQESLKVISSGVYNFEQDPSLHDPVIRNGPVGQPEGKSFAENRKIGTELSLIEWLTQQRTANPSNCILLEPDPLSVSPFEGVSDAHPVTCRLCFRKFTAEALLRNHVQMCLVRNKRIHRHCVPCNKSFNRPTNLKYHMEIRHPTRPRTLFKCKVCDKEYITLRQFKVHEETHFAPDKAKPYKCDICDFSFRHNCMLKLHKLIHSSERNFKCPQCEMSFTRNQHLKLHMKVHTLARTAPTDEEGRPMGTDHNCKFCGKFFTIKFHKEDHERIHTGDRPFKCQFPNCAFAFPSKASLKTHRKIKHGKELGLTQFLCPSCGKKFPLQSHLDLHFLRHHTEEKDKPFKCTHDGCTRRFSVKDDLNKHNQKHTGDKPFQCDQCGLAFPLHNTLKKHQRTHKSE